MTEGALHIDDVRGTLAEDLVGDVYVATLGKSCSWCIHRARACCNLGSWTIFRWRFFLAQGSRTAGGLSVRQGRGSVRMADVNGLRLANRSL